MAEVPRTRAYRIDSEDGFGYTLFGDDERGHRDFRIDHADALISLSETVAWLRWHANNIEKENAPDSRYVWVALGLRDRADALEKADAE